MLHDLTYKEDGSGSITKLMTNYISPSAARESGAFALDDISDVTSEASTGTRITKKVSSELSKTAMGLLEKVGSLLSQTSTPTTSPQDQHAILQSIALAHKEEQAAEEGGVMRLFWQEEKGRLMDQLSKARRVSQSPIAPLFTLPLDAPMTRAPYGMSGLGLLLSPGAKQSGSKNEVIQEIEEEAPLAELSQDDE
jgi:hypothetical protein